MKRTRARQQHGCPQCGESYNRLLVRLRRGRIARVNGPRISVRDPEYHIRARLLHAIETFYRPVLQDLDVTPDERAVAAKAFHREWRQIHHDYRELSRQSVRVYYPGGQDYKGKYVMCPNPWHERPGRKMVSAYNWRGFGTEAVQPEPTKINLHLADKVGTRKAKALRHKELQGRGRR